MATSSNRYVSELLASENEHLDRIHRIIHKSLSEDSLVTQKISEVEMDRRTPGEVWPDRIASFGGSWKFILLFGIVLLVWISANALFKASAFDPYPFILLNLVLSCLAALQAPVIMMSQNRQEAKDRTRAIQDYMVNLKSEIEIRNLHEKLDISIIDQYKHLCQIQQKQIEMLEEITEKLKRNQGR